MKRLSLALLLAAALSSLALVIRPGTPLTSDSQHYLEMVRGNYGQVSMPFRCRIVVPYLARCLPVSPLTALRTITWISLLAVYVLALFQCATLGINSRASALALVAVFCSRPNLYNYYNPYLTDGMGTLVLFALSVSMICGNFGVFAALALPGVFVRESVLFVLPSWLSTSNRWKAVAVGVISVCLILTFHMVIPGSPSYSSHLFGELAARANLLWLRGFIKGMALGWFALWVPFATAFWRTSRPVRGLAVSLVSGALVSCLVATDYERMLFVLSPALVPIAAEAIERAKRSAVLIFVATFPLQFAFGSPYVFPRLSKIAHHSLMIVTVFLSVGASMLLVIWQKHRCADPSESAQFKSRTLALAGLG